MFEIESSIVKKNEAEEEFDVNEDDDDDKSSVLDMDTFMTRTNKKNPKVLSIDRTVFETTRATFDNETENIMDKILMERKAHQPTKIEKLCESRYTKEISCNGWRSKA